VGEKIKVKLLQVRILQQVTILGGSLGGFTINLLMFGFLTGVLEETPGNLSDLYILGLSRTLLIFIGVGILLLGTTKSTETLVRLRDCGHVEELLAVKSALFWYALAGFGLGMMVFYLIMVI
jgi:hypothetical protein